MIVKQTAPTYYDYLAFSWADFDTALAALATFIIPGRSGVYGVPRGGLVLAVALSHLANLPLLTEPDQNALIVDDIADSGATLSAYPNNQRLVLVRRFGAKCRAQAAIYLEEGDHRWVLFPWESRINLERDKAAYASR